MRRDLEKRLSALEAARPRTRLGDGFRPTTCPNEAAQQYRALLDHGHPSPAASQAVPAGEAERIYREVMSDAA